MHCDVGALRAYLDQGVSPAEHAAMDAHLASCASCRDGLESLRQRSLLIDSLLPELEPPARTIPEPEAALAHFRRSQAETGTAGLYRQLRGWMTMIGTSLSANWRRRAFVGASVLAVLLVFFSFAPVRQAAADFLGIFRVRKFAVIPIDPLQAQRLEDLLNQYGETVFGEPTILREEGEPITVEDASSASGLAGFNVRSPGQLPEGSALREIAVQSGPAMKFDIQMAMVRMLAEAAGLQDVVLPDVETATIEIDVPQVVKQEYLSPSGSFTISQMPSPQASIPDGIDPVIFAELGLQLLGMSAADAQEIARSVDWTSTVVIPMPTDVGESSEITVDGVSGLLLEERNSRGSSGGDRMILWERDGIVYAVEGRRIDSRSLLLVADSLQ
jgi:hypothetical protein